MEHLGWGCPRLRLFFKFPGPNFTDFPTERLWRVMLLAFIPFQLFGSFSGYGSGNNAYFPINASLVCCSFTLAAPQFIQFNSSGCRCQSGWEDSVCGMAWSTTNIDAHNPYNGNKLFVPQTHYNVSIQLTGWSLSVTLWSRFQILSDACDFTITAISHAYSLHTHTHPNLISFTDILIKWSIHKQEHI